MKEMSIVLTNLHVKLNLYTNTIEIFPNVFYLIKILFTLLVNICTPERTFSSLKRIKACHKNASGQERLNGPALMSVWRDIKINNEEVINTFALKESEKT